MLKPIAAAAALALSAFAHTSAFAQISTFAPASREVQLLAPQLIGFSGSPANFDSLVVGLTQGTPITLTTLGADGFLQIVTFAPGGAMSPADAARALETARQNLIVRGIAAPTAQQLATSLAGGTLITPFGTTPLAGVLTGTVNAVPIQVRNELATLPTLATAAGAGLNLSASNLQALQTALAQGTPVTLSSTSPTGLVQNVTFTLPGGPMSPFEVNQALQLATTLLAQQGILNPTPDQIRVALTGGNVVNVTGANVALQGVLQGSVRNTSDSRVFGTSNTPPNVTPVVTPPPTTTIRR